MKAKLLTLVALLLLSISCQSPVSKTEQNLVVPNDSENTFNFPDSLSSRRISFVLDLKQAVAKKAWPSFATKKTEGTLIYFHGDKSEIFFANDLVIKRLNDFERHSEDYLLTARTDSLPYHMENMLSFDEADSARFFYGNPVEQYSSVEEIKDYIPFVESTEMWSTMVIHEMFHHYQLNNDQYRNYAKSSISKLPFNPRNLNALCREDQDFLSLIQTENEVLMTALASERDTQRDSLIANYLSMRESRMERYSQSYPELEQVEDFYVIQEGSARYVEFQSMLVLNEYAQGSDSISIDRDPMFKSFADFEEVDLNSAAFEYLVYASPSTYHYTIGFNIMRLLDDLKFEYKSSLIDKPNKGLHKYLEDYLRLKTSQG